MVIIRYLINDLFCNKKLMKRIFENLLKVILILGAVGLLGPGCKKDEKAQNETEQKNVDVNKFERLEKFISISWSVPIAKIKYNTSTEIFSFKGSSITKDQIETLYDRANEYKLKNEN